MLCLFHQSNIVTPTHCLTFWIINITLQVYTHRWFNIFLTFLVHAHSLAMMCYPKFLSIKLFTYWIIWCALKLISFSIHAHRPMPMILFYMHMFTHRYIQGLPIALLSLHCLCFLCTLTLNQYCRWYMKWALNRGHALFNFSNTSIDWPNYTNKMLINSWTDQCATESTNKISMCSHSLDD